MLKRLMVLFLAIASLAVAGCCGSAPLQCESPCYGKNAQRHMRNMVDFGNVYFLNYDRHDPFRCEPCIGN